MTIDPKDTFAEVSRRMKQEWDARAVHDARYFVRQSVLEQEESDFDASGALTVRTFIEADLATICQEKDPKDMRVLEIGCGVGRMTRHLAKIFGDVHGVDVSREMIRRGRERLDDIPNVVLHEGNGVDLSNFPDRFFDFVFSYIVFQHVPDKSVIQNYVRETSRVLKPEGVFKFQVHGGGKNYREDPLSTWSGVVVTTEDVRSWSEAFGFRLLDSKDFQSQYAWVTLQNPLASSGPSLEEPMGDPEGSNDTFVQLQCPVQIVMPVFGYRKSDTPGWRLVLENTREIGARFVWVDCRSNRSEALPSGADHKVVVGKSDWSFDQAVASGTREVTASYWALICEEAVPQSGWLGSLVHHAQNHPEASGVGAALLRVRSSGQVDRVTSMDVSPNTIYTLWTGRRHAVVDSPALVGALLVRSDAKDDKFSLAENTWISTFDLEASFYRRWLLDLGKYYQEQEHYQEAEERFRACLKCFPEDPQALEALKKLGHG